jgi:MYXO-CTERM domain-containing protein
VCVPDKTQGQSCLRDQACTGNTNCVEIDGVTHLGVCCNSPCSGDCQSCLKANNAGADGTCGNVVDDLDPKAKCAQGAAYPNSCAAPGLCNGLGACRPYAKDTIECDTDTCADSTLTTYTCNGAGTCKAKSIQCSPFKSDTANNLCRVACSLDAHCVAGSHCESGTCVGQLGNGQGCSRGAQCGSGFCANIGEGVLQGQDIGAGAGGDGSVDPGADSPGVCCDTQCQGTCSGCKASIKGFGSDGVCEFVKNNTDPANDCEKDASSACGLDGQCNGSGACRLAPTGTSCGASSCQGNSVLGESCNGQGDCVKNQGGIDCAPYVCRDVEGAFQCTNPCAVDNDCQDGYFCTPDSKCSKKLANGQMCETSGICNSGSCVDGVCCDTSCNGQCEACDSAGNEGICSPVQGDPHGNRAKCDHAGEECGGQCDGVNSASCKYKATGTTCGETTCDNGLAKSSACDGQGECRGNKDAECAPYACGTDDTCLARCEQDADCSDGYTCNESNGRCLPSGATCSEDRQSSEGNGVTTPCKPFLCVPASGTCALACAFTTDCAPDFVCEPSTKTCLPAPTGSGGDDAGSCACRAAGSTPNRSGYWALAAFGVALSSLRRRRRAKKSALTSAKPARFAPVSQPLE